MFQFIKVVEYKKNFEVLKGMVKIGRIKLKKINCVQNCFVNRKMQVYEVFIVYIIYV